MNANIENEINFFERLKKRNGSLTDDEQTKLQKCNVSIST